MVQNLFTSENFSFKSVFTRTNLLLAHSVVRTTVLVNGDSLKFEPNRPTVFEQIVTNMYVGDYVAEISNMRNFTATQLQGFASRRHLFSENGSSNITAIDSDILIKIWYKNRL